MPPPLPDRYHLEVRLGRTQGAEEWLATDTVLDRPVQIRVIGPEASLDLREEYLATVQRSTAAFHSHLLSVYDAGPVAGGVFAAYEWTGGTDLSNRQAAGTRPDPLQFQRNAAGLAGALAALHEAGVAHGGISTHTIYYSLDNPAKLGGVGVPLGESDFTTDVARLVEALEQWALGGLPQGLPLSELVDGISPAIDRIFAEAARGDLDSSQLAGLLYSLPDPSPQPIRTARVSLSALWTAAALALAAIGMVAASTVLQSGPNVALPPPPTTIGLTTIAPQTVTSSTSSTTSPAPAAANLPAAPVLTPPPLRLLGVPEVATFDPYGGGGEMDHRLDRLVDGDQETTWRTERYYDPLSLIKAGVGLMAIPPEEARRIELLNITPGTVYTLAWAEDSHASLRDWEPVAAGQVTSGAFFLTLPDRPAGAWLIWFTELPYVGPENYSTSIAEVRFWG